MIVRRSRKFVPTDAYKNKHERNVLIIQELRLRYTNGHKPRYHELSERFRVSVNTIARMAKENEFFFGPGGMDRITIRKAVQQAKEQRAATKSNIVIPVNKKKAVAPVLNLGGRVADEAGRYYAPPAKKRFYVQGSIPPPSKLEMMRGR